MKQLILSLSTAVILLSCKKADTTPSNTTPNTNKDTTQTSIAKYGTGVTDIDGNIYKTVIIGTQEWMGENLKVGKYNDGAVIPNINGDSNWNSLTIGIWCNLKNNDSLGNIYGKLYNWYAVKTNKLCPNGWHVPNNEEWKVLINKLGGDSIAAKHMKEVGTKHWSSPNSEATNISLFSALPAGAFQNEDGFNVHDTGWWTSSEITNIKGGIIFFDDGTNEAYIGGSSKSQGFSVRCLKD
jgi:uncharacterized protein (TIGR02145 family)